MPAGTAPERGSECYNRIRFALDDSDGSLRFRRIELPGSPFCEGVLERLEAYLRGRPLREVDLDEVAEMVAGCCPECRRELVRTIAEQQAIFCPGAVPADRNAH